MNFLEHLHQPTHNLPIPAPQHAVATLAPPADLTEKLIRELATNYVRREGRFYDVENSETALSRDDLQRAFLARIQPRLQGEALPKNILKEVFDTAIFQNNPDPYRAIPVWLGRTTAYPGNPNRRILLESGVCILNSWKSPEYRKLPDTGHAPLIFEAFFSLIFQRPNECDRVLDWLAWCLQNEAKKPNWAVMLYSKEKGTGKSTFCRIAARLFGQQNSSMENSIEKVAAKFNGPILGRKLIVCEEVNLRAESDVGNKLKTLITEPGTPRDRQPRGQQA
jgi:hypothetical protein